MKYKLIALLALGTLTGVLSAQTTAITATITDPDSQVWAGCQWTALVVSPNGPPTISGTPVAATSLVANGTCDSSGVITKTIARTSSFDQANAVWVFTINPNASAPGYTPPGFATTSGSMTVTTQLNIGIRAPRFYGGTYAYGYADGEVLVTAFVPTIYFNTLASTSGFRQWNGSAWTGGSGSGGGAVSSVFTRSGAVVANSGDYSVGQVTGAAPTASPTFTGVVQMTSASVMTLPEFTSTPAVTSNFGYNTTLGEYVGYNGSQWVFPWIASPGGTAAQCAYWISAYNLGSQACSTPSLAFPLTVSGTTTSGGVPYFSNTTTLTSSAILNTNVLIKGGGAGGAPTNTLATDTGTTLTYTGTGGVISPVFTGSGTTPGASSLVAGSGSIPALTANSAGFAAPATGGTAYLFKLPATATAGLLTAATPASGDGVNESAVTITALPTGTITGTIASGTSAMGTSAISSATCATVVTTTATGTASTDAIIWTPNGSIKAITGYVPSTSGGLTIAAYPTANNVNFDVCNWTSGSITPGALTLNWRVVR